MEKVAVVVVAGGSGKRMGMAVKKQYIKLADKEILAHTLEAFQNFNKAEEIILVVGRDEITTVQNEIVKHYGFNKVKKIVAGGAERQDSVYNGLMAVSDQISYVMIHDGARPFIDQETLDRIYDKVIETEAAIVAVPVKDTIKVIDQMAMEVEDTPQREKLWAVQTPQAFKKELLIKAYKNATEKKIAVTDDSMLVEALGKKVSIVMGDYANIKITTKEDLVLAEGILSSRRANKK